MNTLWIRNKGAQTHRCHENAPETTPSRAYKMGHGRRTGRVTSARRGVNVITAPPFDECLLFSLERGHVTPQSAIGFAPLELGSALYWPLRRYLSAPWERGRRDARTGRSGCCYQRADLPRQR